MATLHRFRDMAD